MFDVAPTELLLVAIVALLVIGPKDLPKAMRFVGYWMGKARGVARQFRSGFDSMVREVELAEMEKKWAEENARIMREHPAENFGLLSAPADAGTQAQAPGDPAVADAHADGAHDDAPVQLVEAPVIAPATADPDGVAPTADKAAS